MQRHYLKWGVRAVGVSVAGMASTLASAQQVAPTARTDISVDLGARYDSNVARSNEALAALRGLERSDVVFTPSVSVDIARPFGTNWFTVSGTAGYNVHVHNSQLDRERLQLDTALNVGVGPCRVAPHAYIRRAQSDLADYVVTADPTLSVRNIETAFGAGADLTCGREEGLQPIAGFNYRRGTNSNPLRSRSEYEEWSYNGGIQYSSRAIGTISAFISQRDIDLIGQPLLIGGYNGYRITEYGVRYRRDLGTRLKFAGSLGRSELTGRIPGLGKSSSVTWDAQVTALVSERLQLTGSMGRSISNSLASDSAYVVSRPYVLRLNYAASDRLRFDAGISVIERDYHYATIPLVTYIDHETRTIADAGVTLRSGQRLHMRLGGGYERRDANGSLFDYSSTFVTASVGLRF